MADQEKINEIFKKSDARASGTPGKKKAKSELTESEIGSRVSRKTGCLGGFMYFLFIACLSVALAFFLWMIASDMLSLNKKSFEATVDLPASAFTSETIETFDENGRSTGTEKVTHVDVDYMAEQLKNAGLIEYEWLFKLFCKVSNADVKVDPGEYELKSTYDYRSLIQNMRANSGGVQTADITIPEGYTMLQIFAKFDEEGVADYDELLTAAAESNFKYSFLEGMDSYGALRLEGYLFPDTYQFYINMEPSSAINKLLSTFYAKYSEYLIAQTENMGITIKDVVTIASMIEKEALYDEDRYLVSSVIYNRLAAGMELGFDSTILYLHQDHEGEPTAEMLTEDTPYNTRLYKGLPPTPICNPGMASINAALNPADTSYYYFYADADTGKLNFFSSYEEFLAFAAIAAANADNS